VDAKAGMNAWESWHYLAPIDGDAPDWARAEVVPEPGPAFEGGPVDGARFAAVPASVLSTRSHKAWAAALEDHVYRTASLSVMSCPSLKMSAAPGGTESEFRAHIAQALREKRDAAVDALRGKYASKLATLEERSRRATQKLEREKAQASSETVSSALSVGGSLLGALFGGRRSSAIRKASSAARSVERAGKERADVAHAEADVEAIAERMAALNAELEAEIGRLEAELDPNTIRIETVPVRPKKSDISVDGLALVWCP
jgi:flagellar motility protein MotE (MotC chaperone)